MPHTGQEGELDRLGSPEGGDGWTPVEGGHGSWGQINLSKLLSFEGPWRRKRNAAPWCLGVEQARRRRASSSRAPLRRLGRVERRKIVAAFVAEGRERLRGEIALAETGNDHDDQLAAILGTRRIAQGGADRRTGRDADQ